MAKAENPKKSLSVRFWQVTILSIILLVLLAFGLKHVYYINLRPVNDSPKTTVFNVEKGSTDKDIATNLEKQQLIRSAWAFNAYVSIHRLGGKLQAGTYAFSPSDGTVRIVNLLTNGRVDTKLVTILPGRRIDQVQTDLINDGFSPDSVKNALDPALYADLSILAIKPSDVTSLEGFLWPDSYQKGPDTKPEEIIRQSLLATQSKITDQVKQDFSARGLTPYQGLILTSIILQEVYKPADQPQVAQVFYSRLANGMKLESDATAKYGSVLAGLPPSLTYDSPYNTYIHTGLPPTPIGTISDQALYAATHPSNTDWLYFVSGDDGTTHFSTNLKDHEAATQKYCSKLCNN